MDSRLKSVVFNSCFSPVKVIKDGKLSYYPCGRCEACLTKRSNALISRLSNEFQDHCFAAFITLTYDNQHIPLVRFHEKYNRWIPDYLKPCSSVVSPDSGAVRYEYPPAYMLPEEFGKDCYIPHINHYHSRSVFGCVNRQDVKNFIKRLRVNLNTLLNQEADAAFYAGLSSLLDEYGFDGKVSYYKLHKIIKNNIHFKKSYYDLEKRKKESKRAWRAELFRYFIVAEYGPTHEASKVSYHRPHYHGILFTNNSTTIRLLETAVRKSWTLCDQRNLDFQLITEQKVGGYVSKYVTGNSTLPRILQTELTRTFHLASRRPIEGFRHYSYEKVREMYDRGTFTENKHIFNADGSSEFIDVPLPTFILSRYFPKCRGYASLSTRDKLRVYSRFFAPTTADENITKEVYSHYQLYPRYVFYPSSGMNYSPYPADFYVQDITAARACARWCKHFKCSPDEYLRVLDWFYYKKEMYNLEQQYLLADEHPSQLYDMSIFDDLPEYLGNIHFDERFDFIPRECLSSRLNGEIDSIEDAVIKLRFSRVGRALWDICGIDVTYFYDDAGYLDNTLIEDFLEFGQDYYKDYMNGVHDDIKTSNKSKVLNDDVLNEVY